MVVERQLGYKSNVLGLQQAQRHSDDNFGRIVDIFIPSGDLHKWPTIVYLTNKLIINNLRIVGIPLHYGCQQLRIAASRCIILLADTRLPQERISRQEGYICSIKIGLLGQVEVNTVENSLVVDCTSLICQIGCRTVGVVGIAKTDDKTIPSCLEISIAL